MSERPHRSQGIEYPGVCVIYFCTDGAGRFLMAKRTERARDEHGRWDIGGGGLDFGETIESTIAREIQEEYCTTVRRKEFLGFRDVHRTHNGRATHWIALDFLVFVDPAPVANGEPHKFSEIRWFTRETLSSRDEQHSQFPDFLERYGHRLFERETVQ